MKNDSPNTSWPKFGDQPGAPAGGKPKMINPAPGGGKTKSVSGGGGSPMSKGTR